MSRDAPALVVIGATGYTGRLAAAAAAATGLPLVLAARNPSALRELAARYEGGTPHVVDVTDPASLRRLLRPGDAVLNTAGPFTELGPPVVAACVEVGAHYLDTTGEQPFMRRVHERFDGPARSAGVTIVPAMAFEYALGDCAASLALEALPGRPESLDVVYAWGGAASSRGTRRTILRMLGRRAWFFEDGRWTRRAQGGRHRSVQLESGRTVHAVAFGSGEVLTVPRRSEVRSATGWMVMDDRVARLVPWLAPALPVLVPALRPVLEPLVRRAPDPSPEQRRQSRFTIRVELRGPGGGRAVEVRGTDPYGLTADALVAGGRRLLDSPAAAGGVLAPAELMDPTRFLDSLAERGLEVARTTLAS